MKKLRVLAQYADYAHHPQRKAKNAYGGVGYYRIVKPAEAMRRAGHDVRIVGQEITTYGHDLASQWDEIFTEFDVFWTSYFSSAEAGAAIFEAARRHGKKVIIDIDDNYLDIHESNLLYDRFKAKKKDRAILSTILSFADVITVSTEPLKERLDGFMKEAFGLEKTFALVPNCNELADWPERKAPYRESGRFVVGYTGSHSHQDDLRMVLPAIKELMAKHKNLWFEMLGIISRDEVPKFLRGFTDDMLGRMAIVGATPTFGEYPGWLAERPWDVGIAPLVDTPFTRSKSHIKWMEYAMCGIPTVASRVHPYSMPADGKQTIVDGETGFLVKPDEWFGVIDRLAKNPELGPRIAANAKAQIARDWQYADSSIVANIERALE